MAISTRLIIVWLACTAAATLAPFNFVRVSGEVWAFTAFSEGSRQQEPLHVALNMLLFVPLGILMARGRSRTLNALPLILLVGVVAFLTSFTIEYLQRLLPGRESSLVDVTANTAGAVIGVLTSRALGVELVRAWRRAP